MLLVHSFLFKKRSDMKGNIYNVGLSEANLSKKELCLKIKDQIRISQFSKVNLTKILIKEIILFQIKNRKNWF